MEKLAKVALLLDIYGGLLTPRQRDALDLYYNYDLSLGEIAEMQNISRQGVHDLIKRGEHALYALDEKLNYYERWTAFEDKICQAIKELEELCQLADESFARSPGDIKKRLINLKQKLMELGDTWFGRLENGV